MFWEINKAHDGYISYSEFSEEVAQYGVNVQRIFVKSIFDSISSSGCDVKKSARNRKIEYKQLLARLRHWQVELYGEKVTIRTPLACFSSLLCQRSYLWEYHQKCCGSNAPEPKSLANNLYNPVPVNRADKKTSFAFSFGGADEYEKKIERRLEEERAMASEQRDDGHCPICAELGHGVAVK